MKEAEAIHQVSRPGSKVSVFETYVEIVDKRGLFGFIFPKRTAILTRNITEVEADGGRERIVIRTSDGKSVKLQLGGLGGTATGLQKAILSVLK